MIVGWFGISTPNAQRPTSNAQVGREFFFVLRWFFVVFVLLAGVARAGWIEDRDGTTVIHVKVFDLPDPSRQEASERADVAAINEFKRRFPRVFAGKFADRYKADPDTYGRFNWDDVEVELHQFSGIKIEGLGERVGMGNLLAIAGKVAPDVMYVNFRQSGTYIREGFLYPLDKPEDGYLSAMSEEEKAFRIHSKILPVINRKGPAGEKHTWAMPFGGALGKVLLYRKDLFDRVDVPYPGNDWTWDDMLSACRKIADPANGTYGIWLSSSKHEAAYWLTFLWSAGGDVLQYDESTDSWRAVYNSDAAANALDYYTTLCAEKWTDSGGRTRDGYACRESGGVASARWKRGEIGMRLAYIDGRLFSEIDPEVTGMAPVPMGPTGIRGAELNSRMMGLFAGIEDRAVRDAAWEYIRFFDSREATGIKTKIMVEGGYGRFLNPTYLKMFGYDEVIRLSPRGWSECFKIAIDTGRPEPYAENCNAVYDIMTQPIREAQELAKDKALPTDRDERLAVLKELLVSSAKRADEEMLGIVPEPEKNKRRLTALLGLIGIVAGFTWVVRKAWGAFSPPGVTERHSAKWGLRRYAVAYGIMMPALLTILFWQYIPLLRGSVMAFQDYKVMGVSRFVWLDNFGDVLWSAEWWMSVWNSLRYSTLVISMTFLPPIILAILLQEVPKGRLLFRIIFYLPAAIAGLVTILLWKMFYDRTERGALNVLVMRIPAIAYIAIGILLLLIALVFVRRLFHHGSRAAAVVFLIAGGAMCYTMVRISWPMLTDTAFPVWRRLFLSLGPQDWLRDGDTAMFCCVLPMVWAGVGPGCLIYLAALKTISDEMYEVADIEGATFVDKILFVVFPMLKALLIINFVGVFIASWKATANILAMTGGQYGSRTEVAGLHIFYQSFMHLRFGPATAMAWVLGFILIGFTVNQLKILSRMEFRTSKDSE